MAKRGKKTLMDSLKGIVVSGKSPGSKAGRSAKARAKADNAAKLQRRDLLSPFVVATIDLDPLINPLPGRARPIPNELPSGRVLVSQQHGIKCLLLADLEKVGIQKLRSICARKLSEEEAIFMPMGTQILRDEALHQGKRFTIKLRKGTLFLSPGGHPNGYLLEPLQLPLRKELSQNHQFLMVTEQIAERYLQNLVDIPASFAVVKEDVFFDESGQSTGLIEKGTLVISRSGALTGLMLDDINLPIKGPVRGGPRNSDSVLSWTQT